MGRSRMSSHERVFIVSTSLSLFFCVFIAFFARGSLIDIISCLIDHSYWKGAAFLCFYPYVFTNMYIYLLDESKVQIVLKVVLPSLISGVFFMVFYYWLRFSIIKWIATISFAISFMISIQLVSIPCLALLNYRDVRRAKSYCEGLIPEIEEYRTRTGAYPKDIEEILPWWPLKPRLIRQASIYYSNDRTFSFSFSHPGFMRFFDQYVYSSEAGEWELLLD